MNLILKFIANVGGLFIPVFTGNIGTILTPLFSTEPITHAYAHTHTHSPELLNVAVYLTFHWAPPDPMNLDQIDSIMLREVGSHHNPFLHNNVMECLH